MKKLLSIALVLVLILSLGTTAFAAKEPTVEPGDELVITKNLKVKGYMETGATTTKAKYPADTVSFTTPVGTVSEGGTLATAAPELTVTGCTITEGDTLAKIFVTVPDFPDIGIYTYTFKENASDVAGVTVLSTDITVIFTVIQGDSGKPIVAAVHCENPVEPIYFDDEGKPTSETANSKKTSEFDNTFEAGALEVSKTVTGNMGDQSKKFAIKVTFESDDNIGSTITYGDNGKISPEDWQNGSASVTVQLAHGESALFDNIPKGVTYSVVELDEDGSNELSSGDTSTDKYKVTITNPTGDIAAETLSSSAVTNEKNADIDTGITLDSLPYIMIAVLVLAGLAVMVIRKRRYNED